MRVLRVDRDLTVAELDQTVEEWMSKDITWDATDLDPHHDIFFDDEGMFRAGSVVARIGDKRVPLPAIVAGSKGENTVDATIGVEELQRLVT